MGQSHLGKVREHLLLLLWFSRAQLCTSCHRNKEELSLYISPLCAVSFMLLQCHHKQSYRLLSPLMSMYLVRYNFAVDGTVSHFKISVNKGIILAELLLFCYYCFYIATCKLPSSQDQCFSGLREYVPTFFFMFIHVSTDAVEMGRRLATGCLTWKPTFYTLLMVNSPAGVWVSGGPRDLSHPVSLLMLIVNSSPMLGFGC